MTVNILTLGCSKNLVDSEHLLAQFRASGYKVLHNAYEESADVVIINTCGFILDAKEESVESILAYMEEKRQGNIRKLFVMGCLSERYREELRKEMPEVDGFFGVWDMPAILEAMGNTLDNRLLQARELTTPSHYAYLKISEGCNHKCTFCIIPSMRGKLDSRPVGDVLSEAERLVDAGVKELLVISQDTSAYGVDLKYKLDFWGGKPVKTRMTELCRELGSLGAWVRLHYVYPYPHVDELIPLMAEGLVLPYLDIPLQHGSPRILKLMKRPAAAENALNRIRKWREICPDITLRSTFIVGFPGETEDDFEQLLEFINEAQLDRVGCFQYSPVAGARANHLPGHVPAEIMAEREQAFMQLQADISRNRLKAKVGSVQKVLVDGVDENVAIARSSADAPEIDGQVYILDGQHLQAGDLLDVKITDADDYDLSGLIQP